jgi:hypothetical protein
MTVFRNKQRQNRWVYEFQLGKVPYRGYCIDPDTKEEARTKREAAAVEEKIRVKARQEHGRPTRGVKPGSFTLSQAVALHIKKQVDSSPLHVENLKNYAREILDGSDRRRLSSISATTT